MKVLCIIEQSDQQVYAVVSEARDRATICFSKDSMG